MSSCDLIKEELGIGQARANHALVAANHGAGTYRADVADYQKPVCQFAHTIEQRKYFWFAFIVRIRHSWGTSRNSFELADEYIAARRAPSLRPARHRRQWLCNLPTFAAAAASCRAISALRSATRQSRHRLWPVWPRSCRHLSAPPDQWMLQRYGCCCRPSSPAP